VRGTHFRDSRLRDDDQIGGSGWSWLSPEDLSNQSFSSVSHNRSPQLSAGDDTETRRPSGGGGRDDGEVTAVGPAPRVEDALEFAAAANPSRRRQGLE